MSRFWRVSRVGTRTIVGQMAHAGARRRTAIVDHGNPSARYGTSTTAPGTTVTCANDAEVRDGLEHWTNTSLYSGVWQMCVIFHPSYTIGG